MEWWAALLAALAVVLLVICPIAGVILFHPRRALAVKEAEANTDIVVQHITELAVIHPEIIKLPRVDRHPFFLAPHVGVFAYACCLFAGATVTSNVAAMPAATRYTMATCFLIGSALVLVGSLMGVQVGRWTLGSRVRRHVTAPLLGDDISLPYWLDCAGLFAVGISMAIYSSTSFKSTTGSLGGWLTAALAIAAICVVPTLYARIREFERNEAVLLAEVQARIGRGAVDDVG